MSTSTSGAEPNDSSDNPSISGDGRYIAFQSAATNLIAGDANLVQDIFVRDTTLSATSRVSVANQTGVESDGVSDYPAISGDGRYVAFRAIATNLVLGVTPNAEILVHDRTLAITRRVSTTADGLFANGSAGGYTAISDNGLFVGFDSFASNLVAGDTNGWPDVFNVNWPLVSAPPNLDLMRNGNFAGGTARWLQFATPDMSYIVSNVTAGVFNYYRVPPPPGTANQAVVFQNTTAQLMAGAPIVATFDLANTSTARKRISILIHDADFSDLHVCTLWLLPNAPMRAYTMRTHTTENWTDATIAFYAATAGNDGGFYQVDNVTLTYAPAQADDRTDCVDPTTPAPPGGAPSANLITNGDFAGGLAPWGLFGQIVSQIAGGVFEFYRPAGTPAGVVLQGTGQPMTAGQIVTATFDLGNSSSVRKRVTLILHEGDFSDLMACTFWLPPNSPLQTFQARAYTTAAWLNATLSLYGATVGTDQWIRFDNAALQRTPAAAIVGAECIEPAAGPPPASSIPAVRAGGVAIGNGTQEMWSPGSTQWSPGSLDPGSSPTSRLRYWLPPSEDRFEIQISDDGEDWRTLSILEPHDGWRLVTIDPGDGGDRWLYVRLIRAR